MVGGKVSGRNEMLEELKAIWPIAWNADTPNWFRADVGEWRVRIRAADGAWRVWKIGETQARRMGTAGGVGEAAEQARAWIEGQG